MKNEAIEIVKQIFNNAKDALTYDEETTHYFRVLKKEVLKILDRRETANLDLFDRLSNVIDLKTKQMEDQQRKLRELADMLKTRPSFYELSKDGKHSSKKVNELWIKLTSELLRVLETKLFELRESTKKEKQK